MKNDAEKTIRKMEKYHMEEGQGTNSASEPVDG